MVNFKFYFMQFPQIPYFYLANLETLPFFDDFLKPVGAWGCYV